MNWDSTQLAAKAKGQLIFAMDQAQLPIGKVPIISNLTEQGFCLGLSVSWIAKQYDGDDFWHSSQVCEWPPIKAILYQELAGLGPSTAWTDFWKTGGVLEQLTLSPGLRSWRNTKPTSSHIYSVVTKSYGCYGITLEGSGGAHAVAIRHNPDNRMQFFDPNYGHFAVKNHTVLKDFLRWFLKDTGYYGLFETGHGVVGIRPPIGSAT
jgi:hypothetical protein